MLEQQDLKNRVVGRPPAVIPKQAERAAVVDTTQRHVPPLVCPVCQRGMTPKVERWRPDGSADCVCSLDNCRFVYKPASVRAK